jgi:ribosomal protein L11 methyltransferase
LCLRAMDWYVRPGSTVIDLGTGSGILAIAAARLGAQRVVALDSDPIAIEVAKANVRSNRVASVVTVRRGNSLAGVHAAADVIVANLTADILPPIVSDVPRRLSPGGRFVASGFGSARSSEVEAAFLRAGLTVTSVERLRGWCAVHGVAARSRRVRLGKQSRGTTLPR